MWFFFLQRYEIFRTVKASLLYKIKTCAGGDDNYSGCGNDPHIRMRLAGGHDWDVPHQRHTDAQDACYR